MASSNAEDHPAAGAATGPVRDVPVDWDALEDAFENNAPEGKGGGIFNDGTVTLTHTLVVHNTLNNCSPAASVPGCFG